MRFSHYAVVWIQVLRTEGAFEGHNIILIVSIIQTQHFSSLTNGIILFFHLPSTCVTKLPDLYGFKEVGFVCVKIAMLLNR